MTTVETTSAAYVIGGRDFVRVTTAIDSASSKPGLVPWASKLVAERARDYVLGRIAAPPDAILDGSGAAVERFRKWLSAAPNDAREKAADIGTLVHAAVEASSLGAPMEAWPGDLQGHGEQFARFLEDFLPEWILSEGVVVSDTHRYAGRLDAIASIEGRRVVLDVKTGKNLYGDSLAMQIAAYRYAERMIDHGGSEWAVPEVQGAMVLHLRPEKYELRMVDAGPAAFDAFLAALAIHRWRIESKRAIGPAMERSEDERIRPLRVEVGA